MMVFYTQQIPAMDVRVGDYIVKADIYGKRYDCIHVHEVAELRPPSGVLVGFQTRLASAYADGDTRVCDYEFTPYWAGRDAMLTVVRIGDAS